MFCSNTIMRGLLVGRERLLLLTCGEHSRGVAIGTEDGGVQGLNPRERFLIAAITAKVLTVDGEQQRGQSQCQFRRHLEYYSGGRETDCRYRSGWRRKSIFPVLMRGPDHRCLI